MHKQKGQPAAVLTRWEQKVATTHSGSEGEYLTFTKEAIVLICDSTGWSGILD